MGARGINQRLPPIAPTDLPDAYRDMCRFILCGSVDIPLDTEKWERRTLTRPASERS
ncbi:MAG: hypothetical protein AB1508_02350 [Pseudomonadota bacterium]